MVLLRSLLSYPGPSYIVVEGDPIFSHPKQSQFKLWESHPKITHDDFLMSVFDPKAVALPTWIAKKIEFFGWWVRKFV
jgi:hypothetical protein